MPVLAIGGGVSYPHGRGRGSAPEQSLSGVALDVRGEVVADCGHFIPEEAPDLLVDRLLAFFNEERPDEDANRSANPESDGSA